MFCAFYVSKRHKILMGQSIFDFVFVFLWFCQISIISAISLQPAVESESEETAIFQVCTKGFCVVSSNILSEKDFLYKDFTDGYEM